MKGILYWYDIYHPKGVLYWLTKLYQIDVRSKVIFEGEIIFADIGGKHARFAVAQVSGVADIDLDLDRIVTLKTGDYSSLQDALVAYTATLGSKIPQDAAIAIAASLKDERIALTNARWNIDKSALARELSLDRYVLINDFVAVGYAVANLKSDAFDPVCGPGHASDDAETITIVGPGTGLGVAQIGRSVDEVRVIKTEGGHIGLAPTNEFEDQLLHHLRRQHGRVSVKRVVSGSGLRAIYGTMVTNGDAPALEINDRELWQIALSGDDTHAAKSLQQFCAILGSVAGDIALVQGAEMLVLAGGLGRRLSDHFSASDFAKRFSAKGRFRGLMEMILVKKLNHPEPGLYGASAAFCGAHGTDYA